MKLRNRIFLSIGIVIASAANCIDDNSIHISVSIGMLINLIWLWDDVLETRKHVRKIHNIMERKRGHEC